MTILQRASVTVETGVLSPSEFGRLTQDEQVDVEQSTTRLLTKYGRPWLAAQRAQLRADLSLAYGCC